MSAGVLETFCASLDRLEVGWTRTAAASLSSALNEVIERPAVGTPLPFDGLSLAETDVTTDPTPGELDGAQTGVTAARMGIAPYGSIVIQSGANPTEAASLFPAHHVAVLRAADVVPDMRAAFQRLGETLRAEPTTAVLATGPSATADMGALVRGAHGPAFVHVVIIDDQ